MYYNIYIYIYITYVYKYMAPCIVFPFKRPLFALTSFAEAPSNTRWHIPSAGSPEGSESTEKSGDKNLTFEVDLCWNFSPRLEIL